MKVSPERLNVINSLAEIAINWLRHSRKHYSHNAECWDFLYKKSYLDSITLVINGGYVLKPMQLLKGKHGYRACWCAEDAFVLKFITLYISQYQLLSISPLCSHTKTSVGNKAMVKYLSIIAKDMKFVFRTDIKGYFSNIDKRLLLERIEKEIKTEFLLNILCQYIFYSVEYGGNVRTTQKGISRGCGLSHQLAAYHLHHIDLQFERNSERADYFYTRYMDDFLILTQKRHPMRKGIKIIKRSLADEGLELASGKTQLGRVEHGFDWLGVWIDHSGVVGASPRALRNRDEKLKTIKSCLRKRYLERWNRWLNSYTT